MSRLGAALLASMMVLLAVPGFAEEAADSAIKGALCDIARAEADSTDPELLAARFRYYYRGDNNTPINKWFLSGRFRSHESLADNIDK